ncbi:uncharacterized protein LOC133730515 [Rosa rugosa]|uniref:uncharacterized protein LOC133730515 n=1 Tax=Rosa rugosa TaxID=74645 RepID=UPI002B409841|nr:uncharacterized protein LOC133730515 [Rosa rugosa]
MSKEISSSVIHCKEARDMWTEIQERFSHTNTVQLFNIENAIHDCEQGANSVTAFFTKLKSLWDEKDALCTFPPCQCEAAAKVKAYLETQKTMKFLMGLGESYATIRSNVIGMDPLPNVNKAYAMALRNEKQAEVSNGKTIAPPPEASTHRATNSTEGEKKCEKCNMTNHSTKNCRAHLKCIYCNGKGHTYEYCRRRKNAMEGGQQARANHVASSSDNKEGMTTFPFSQEECNQMLGLLSKFKTVASNQDDYHQMLGALNKPNSSAVNLVGNVPNYEELSGKSFNVPRC